MIRIAFPAAVLLLTACSSEPAQRAEVGNAEETSDLAATASPGLAEAPSTPTRKPVGSELRGDVSALAGDVSGLNTRVTNMGLVIDLPSDALFDFDKATLTPDAEAQLHKAANLIRQSPPGPLQVIGHTDNRGDDAYNQRLSNDRANSVADWLKQQVGVRTRAFTVTGKGESEPIAHNTRPDGSDDPAGRSKNRRVEVIIPREAG